MPKIVIPLENTDSTVTRLVAKSVIEALVYSTEMPEITDIIYIQRGGKSLSSQTNNNSEPLKLDVDNYIQVEYHEINTESYIDVSKYQDEFPAILSIPKVGVAVTPMHNRVDLEMTFTYKSKNYGDLTNWLNAFKRRLLNCEAAGYHDVLYNYSIPDGILAYINQVYQATERVAPYGITLKQFMQRYFAANGLMVRKNLSNSQQQLAINIKNTGCLGRFTQLPEVQETGREPPISTLTFTYTLTYDRVTALILEYQLYVHNQLLDLKLINPYYDIRPHFNQHSGHLTVSQSVNMVTKDIYGIDNLSDPNIAAIDGWRPRSMYNNLVGKLITPIQLNPNALTEILDINDLVSLGMPQQLITFMLLFKIPIFQLYKWFVYVDLFEVNDKITKIPLLIEPNTTMIKAGFALDLRNRYYLRLSSNLDLTHIDWNALLNYYDLLFWLFGWLYPGVSITALENGLLDMNSILEVISKLTGKDLQWNRHYSEQRSTLISFDKHKRKK